MDETRVGPDEEQLLRLAVAADVEIDRRAKSLDGSKEAQQRIFELQREKQNLMAELKKILALIDGKESREFHKSESDRLVWFDTQKKVYFVGEGDSQEVATLGEVLFDNDFGASYVMDFSDATIPRLTRKRFALEQTKRQLHDLLNRQIIEEETSRPDVAERVKEIYQSLERKQERTEVGFLAERVVEYLLKRLEWDEAVPFKFVMADVHQDVAQKIDFIIKVQKKSRGVSVEASQMETIGIQFTMNEERVPFKLGQIEQAKREGLDKVDDLVLVSIPIEHINTVLYQWEERRSETGKTAGGPVTFLLSEEKEVLMRGMFSHLFEAQEMETYVAHAKRVFEPDQERVREEERRLSMVWEQERKKSPGRHRREAQQKAARQPKMKEDSWSSIETVMKEIQRQLADLHNSWLEEIRRWKTQKVPEEARDSIREEFRIRREDLNEKRHQVLNVITTRKNKRQREHAELIIRLKRELAV